MKVGIDSVLVKRFEKLKNLDMFLNKNFTEYEKAYIVSKNKHKFETLAGLFCAKEAFLKALGIGVRNGVALNKIEVNHNNNGAPYYKIEEEVLSSLEVKKENIALSITHTKTSATAICIIE